jgi:hypothetical protein
MIERPYELPREPAPIIKTRGGEAEYAGPEEGGEIIDEIHLMMTLQIYVEQNG